MDDFFCANSFFQSGRRVILAHNVVSFHVDMVAMSAQTMIHCNIQLVSSSDSGCCSGGFDGERVMNYLRATWKLQHTIIIKKFNFVVLMVVCLI